MESRTRGGLTPHLCITVLPHAATGVITGVCSTKTSCR